MRPILAAAWNATGEHVASVLNTLEPYHLTTSTAVEIARLATGGEAMSGYQTTATAHCAASILEFDGVRRTDMDGRSHIEA